MFFSSDVVVLGAMKHPLWEKIQNHKNKVVGVVPVSTKIGKTR